MSDSVISDLQHIQTTGARILAKCGNSFIHSKVIFNERNGIGYQSIFVTIES